MIEAEFDDERYGRTILSFDGRIIEIFRAAMHEGRRGHIQISDLGELDGPDRKGRCVLWLIDRVEKTLVDRMAFDQAALPAVQKVIDAVRAAR